MTLRDLGKIAKAKERIARAVLDLENLEMFGSVTKRTKEGVFESTALLVLVSDELERALTRELYGEDYMTEKESL